jgi:two-component system chemotaxis response regulator CheY
MKTLIVEDDVTSRLILHRLLMPHGDCHVAASGEEALRAFEAARDAGTPYDLVCLDIMLPGVRGLAILSRIRAIEQVAGVPPERRTRVVMTTGVSDRESVAAAIAKQCDGYLVKPISADDLMKRLRALSLI